MGKTNTLGTRMKEYESVTRHHLTRHMPIIIRLDMRAGHTFTKSFVKPFDEHFMYAMHETMKNLCENIQGCKLGYTQSDEISLLLTDYDDINTSAWFDNNLQKIISISASMATLYFNRAFAHFVLNNDTSIDEMLYSESIKKGAVFDSRAFAIPKEDVANYFLWRQNDATRNSIEAVGRAYFSHKELMNESCNDIQNKLLLQKDINWSKLPTVQKRGCCAIQQYIPGKIRKKWVMDYEIPIFKGEGRKYIELAVNSDLLNDIIQNVSFDLYAFEPADPEGHSMEGIAIYKGNEYHTTISAASAFPDYVTEIAHKIYEQILAKR